MGQRPQRTTQRVAAIAFISAAFCVSLSVFPSSISADIVGTQTRALIAVAGSACVPLSAYGFTPYVYDGALHSFEFTVPDSSYVALTGTVGNTSIPFQFMTRRGDANSLRVHVDVATTPISGMLPLSVTLVSSKGSQQSVCMATVVMAASSAGVESNAVIKPQEMPGTGADAGAMPPKASVSPSSQDNLPSLLGKGAQSPTSTVSDLGVTSSVDTETTPSVFANLQNKIVASCMAISGAMRLWVILLAIYAAITAFAVFAQLPAPQTYSLGQRVATIVAPLVLLLGFWYLAETCRATPWALVAAIAIALLGVAGLYRSDPRFTVYADRVNLFKQPSKQNSTKSGMGIPMITPPPAQKPNAPAPQTTTKP